MPLNRLLPILAALLGAATVALVAGLVASAWQNDERATAAARALDQLRLSLVAAEMVSRERGPTNGLLGEALPPQAERVQALEQARARTDGAFQALAQALRGDGARPVVREAARQLESAQQALLQARAEVERTAALPKPARAPERIRATVLGMVAVVPLLAPVTSELAQEAERAYPALGNAVHGARMVAELREYAGLLGSHFTAPLAAGQRLTPTERLAIERTRGRIDELRFLIDLRLQLRGQTAEVKREWDAVDEHYFRVANGLVDRMVAAGETDAAYGLDPAGFAALYVPDMNVMFGLRDALLGQAAALTGAEREQAQRRLWLGLLAAGAVLALLAGSILLLWRRVLRPLAIATQALHALARGEAPVALPEPAVRDEMADVFGAVRTLQTQTQERDALEQERDGLIERLREQSNSDFLTGLPNRRAFFAGAERELSVARRHHQSVVAILFDIDDFKAFNDRLGHAAGDRALADVAQAVRRELRMGDLVGRYGGEEFVLLLVQTDRDSGLRFAERLRLAIAATAVACPDGSVAHVTASLGVADSAQHGLALEALLAQADAAMYRAKQGGRNRVEVAEGGSDAGHGWPARQDSNLRPPA